MESIIGENRKIESALKKAAIKILSGFGPSVQTSVFFHLKRIEGVDSDEEALNDPLRFSAALEAIFSKGAVLIEDKIISAMCDYLGLEYEVTKGSFEEKIARIYELESGMESPFLLKIGALEQTMAHPA